MKYAAVAVGLMVVGAVAVGAQPTSAPPVAVAASTNALGPKIQFATSLFDFGRMKGGEPVKHTYVFTNTGDQVLTINSVQPQCGCTTAGDWTRQVAPGQTGSIPIQFNTLGYNGPVFKQVTVSCNVTSQPTLFLQLKGTVFKPVDFSPPMAIINLPPDAETASVIVTITNNTEEPLVASAPESNNRMFSAQLVTNTPGKGFQLTVSVVPPLSMGSVQAQISLRTGWTNPAVVTIPIVANVQPAVMVIPSYITVAAGPLSNAVTNSVTIQNNSTNPLVLSEPTVSAPGVEPQIKEVSAGRSFTATLIFPVGFEYPPGRQVELNVKSSNLRFPVIKVPVMQAPRPFLPPPPMTPAVLPVMPPKPKPQVGLRPRPLPPPMPIGQ